MYCTYVHIAIYATAFLPLTDFESTLNEAFNSISNELALLVATLNETVTIYTFISSRNYSTIKAELDSYQMQVDRVLSQSELLFLEAEYQFERITGLAVMLNELVALLEAARNRAVQTAERSQQALNSSQQAEDLVVHINVSLGLINYFGWMLHV